MAKNDNVVIIGSLNDQELKNSIDALVKHVEAGTQKMATNFDNTIEGMKKKLQSLGNISIDMGGASDGGGSRRAKKIQDEAQGVRNLTISYDQLAIATQRAMQPKSAQDSFYTFLQSYREHAAALARELKQMPSASLDRQFAEYQRFESEIMRVQERIRELRSQLNEVGKNPNASRFEVKAITDEIGLLENKIRQLTSEQIANTRRIANEDNMAFSQKKALYDNTLQIIREMTTVEKQGTTAILSQVDAQEQLNRKVQRQAEIIRQRMAESGKSVATWGSAVIYDPSIKKDHASIEEQLTRAHQDQLRITQERIAAEQREKQTKQETLAVTQQQAQAEQQVTSAQQRSGVKSTPKTFQNYEDFRAALAHVLGLQQQEIKLADEETASYNKLSATLKTLQSAYNQLSASERNSDNGRTLVASMHEVERAMQQIRAQAARPVNIQSALGLSEKTLDDIAYKLRTLQSYRSGLDLTKQADEVKRTTQEIDRLQKKQNEVIGTTRRWAKENDAVSRSFDYIKNRLAFMFTIGAATNFVKQIYEIRGQYELLERSIGILVDSMQQGSQIFAELNAMAIKSPFTTMELGAAAKQLTAYDIAAKDVVDTTKRLADMAAAVGVPIERLTYALGQIKAYGYLNARDARMFANAGIPLVQELADRYTELEGRLVSVGDVYDRIKKKAISFEDVLDVINTITDEGGRFFNFQEKAADTLKVKLANLTLAFNNMMNEIGKSNQSLLTMPLTTLKTLFEHWRDINNIMRSVAISFGLVKLAQIAYYVWMRNSTLAAAAHVAVGAKLVTTLTSLKAAFVGFVTNPFAMAIAGLTLMGVLLAKAVFNYRDLQQANGDFNRSIANNADENIKSIDKFFDEYKKQLDGIGGENATAQQKMWERLREEIEKASKTAQTYLQILDNIGDVSKRISAGREVLEQIQEINKEAKKLAERELFSVGGGFANDSLAKNLREYEQQFNELIKDYGSLENAAKDAASETAEAGMGISFHSWWNYLDILKEAERELDKFSSVLDNANLEKVMGDGTPESQLANIREFTSIIRDGFLATEQGQKVSASGRALLNKRLDEWIANQGVANKLIDEESATIERNRTAWETFFDQLSKKDKERLDYMVATNQTGSKDFQDIWDKATQNMIENANTSYLQIQDQIANLRNTPDIVIKVVYRETKEKLDAQQEQFQRDFLTPKGKGVLSPEKYFEERKRLTEKYARFQKKESEDNVEWEKRLGDEYRKNEESIKKLNRQLENSANLSTVDKKAKEDERDALVNQNKALDEIKTKQNFNYEKDKKNVRSGRKGEDVVAEALKQELQLIREMQSNYDKLRKSGVSNMDAIDIASKGYEATIIRINQVLSKFGIDKFNAANFAGKDVRSLLQSLEEQRQALLASGKVKTSSLQALDVEIQKLTVDAKTYDMKKVTDGLNSELGKIKDEYELAIELDANPELGDMFTDMFNVNTSTLPQTFGEAYQRAVEATQKQLAKLKEYTNANFKPEEFDLMKANFKPDENGQWFGIDVNSQVIQDLIKAQKTWRDMYQKNLVDTEKMLDDYVKKYGDYSDKIAEIEANRLNQIKKLNDAYYTDAMRNSPEYERKRQAINTAAVQEKSQAQWDNFTNTRLYVELFENLELASTGALRAMKEKLDEVKGSMNNLKPEQLKQITAQYMKLEKELMSRNPFKGAIKHAKDYMKAVGKTGKQAQKDFITAQRNYDAQEKVVATLKEQYEQKKAQEPTNTKAIEALAQQLGLEEDKLAKLKEILNAADQEAQKYNMMTKLFKEQANEIAALLQAIGQNLQSLADLRDNLQSTFGFEFSDSINAAIDGLARMGKGISGAVSSAQSGDVFGVLNGVVDVFAGIGDGIASLFGDGSARTKKLNREINESRETVRQLSMAYDDLERAIDKSLGTGETEARRLAIANKEAQLSELERQKELEQSKRSKDRDDDAIKQYEESIHSLRNEIDDLKQDVVNNLWGEDVKSAAEAFVDAWVQAWRAGETTLDAIREKMDEMIYNLIKKAMTSKIVETLLNPIYKELDRMTKEGSEGGIALTTNELRQLAQQAGITAGEINTALGEFYGNLEQLGVVSKTEDKSSELSALQQGIQGVTEDTAGAIEAYMNIVAQRIFEQNLYLQEIRDHLNNFDIDVQLGTLSQMLLQLQQSYQVQQNIESILTGVLNPSGRAIVVELNS